ncbi:MAG: MATE family efflux transporter, partial [Lachnospiraceae bacterium]|nr:MATE family efflux transporter [Lachnospiraceae bacterium]
MSDNNNLPVKNNMLTGSLADKLILFALPLAASNILQQLFNSVDVAVAGRFAEDGALGAVGANTAIIA